MARCTQCGTQLGGTGNFCPACGRPAISVYSHPQYAPQPEPPAVISNPPPIAGNNPHHLAARGFAQTFGLHPACALLTVVVNTMVFTSGLVTGGVGWLISIPIGMVLGVIIFLAQKKWYGDDNEEAFIKALIVAFLTAIPTSLPGYLTIPSGIIGFFRRKD
jgi:hypothetical protein